jgi:DNA polymerase I-like protein with 3'-5' exonuclease and polymerase domains
MTFYAQLNDEPLIECSDLVKFNIEGGYSIVPLVHSTWPTSEKRLLVIVETVDSLDLKNQSLLSGLTDDPGSYGKDYSDHNPMRSILSNILDLGIDLLKPYDIKFDEDNAGFAFGICNFNCRKIRNLETHKQQAAFPAFTARVLKVIRKLKPTHVLVCGDTANRYLLQELDAPEGTEDHLCKPTVAEHSEFKRGWVLRRKVKDHEFFYTPTLDLEGLYRPSKKMFDEDEEDDGAGDKYAAADLLYFVTRNIANLFAEKMLHSIADIKLNPIYVDTIKKFDKFYAKLLDCKIVATDTETKALSNVNNAIYVAQFAMTVDKGYVIPIRHPKSPFTEEEADYISKKLRKFLLSKKRKVIVTLNGTFDTRIYRTQLDIPLIPYHQIHEITAGEQLLDENLGLFGRLKLYMNGEYVKTSYQNLRAMCCLYGNDWYFRAAFSKEERHLTGSRDPDDPDVLNYCAADVQFPLGIALEQYKRAERQMVKPSKSEKKVPYSNYFSKALLNTMSNTVQAISHMEQNGSPVDIDYMEHLMGKKSPLLRLMKETLAEMNTLPNVQRANQLILEGSGKATTSLFGNDISMSVFDPNKKSHNETLFFDVMKLKVIGLTKTGQRAIDKHFTAAYRGAHKEVALKETLTKAGKLWSTYVKGWLKLIRSNADSALDFCLRPSFGFFTIVTGRLNSFNPSLQQVPSRGALADYIKRAFVPPVGYMNIRADYSAHEIRGWSILAGDLVVAGSFQAGLDLRRSLIQQATDVVPKDIEKDDDFNKALEAAEEGSITWKVLKRIGKILKTRKELKTKGDFHIANCYRIFKRWVEKSDPLRDAVKQLIFGILYGKGAKTLARDIGKPLEEAQEIIDKLFEEFPDGAAWLEDAIFLVKKHGHVMTPSGRVRRLWRVYTGKRGVIAAAGRRAQNSPIQGFASEMGCTAAFLILVKSFELIKELEWDLKECMPKYNRAVHDANYFIAPFKFLIPFIHIQQYMSTNGIADYYEEKFGLKFTIEPEIEIELGASESKYSSYKWSWEIPELLTIIYSSLVHLSRLGRLKPEDVDPTFDLIIEPWVDPKLRAILQERFPLLNVKDLDSQIESTLRKFVRPIAEKV